VTIAAAGEARYRNAAVISSVVTTRPAGIQARTPPEPPKDGHYGFISWWS
jgi:hypothetical protein